VRGETVHVEIVGQSVWLHMDVGPSCHGHIVLSRVYVRSEVEGSS